MANKSSSTVGIYLLLLTVSNIAISPSWQCEPGTAKFDKITLGFYERASSSKGSLNSQNAARVSPQKCGHSLYWNAGENPEDDDGHHQRVEAAAGIIGGLSSVESEFPWQVKIGFQDESKSWICSGSIIDHSLVLTAAHCCSQSATKIEVMIEISNGDSYLMKELIPRHNVFRHPQYSSDQQFDFCMIRLEAKLDFTKDWSIQKICLPTSCAETCQPGDLAIITGWGVTNPDMSVPTHLQKAIVPIWTNSKCMEKYGRVEYNITEQNICAGYEVGGVSTCYGDSGSALGCYKNGFFTLDGVASWGALPCTTDYPAVFGRVCSPSVLSWIHSFH